MQAFARSGQLLEAAATALHEVILIYSLFVRLDFVLLNDVDHTSMQ